MDKRSVYGIAAAILAFLFLRLLDVIIARSFGPGPRIIYDVGSEMRVMMSLGCAAALGTYISRGKILKALLILVLITWGFSILSQYLNRTDYIPALQVRDLNWLGVPLAVIATLVGDRLGKWIWELRNSNGRMET